MGPHFANFSPKNSLEFVILTESDPEVLISRQYVGETPESEPD